MEQKMLLDALETYAAGDFLPMHMPGHKRSVQLPYLETLCARLDITEIDGFDNLHAPHGLLQQAQQRAAMLWGAAESYFLVNGSSGGILAGLYAATRRGDEIILTRAAHKSVFHAIELCGLIPRYLLPPYVAGTDIFASISPQSVADALAAHPNAKLLLLTSPTYEGVISDIAAIAKLCHEKGVVLMVDEAHGAHLGIGGAFPPGACACGADIVVQSLHKTLPSLTQTAILHRCSDRVDPARLRHALAVFQTSSPSYLLMASIDACVTSLAQDPEILVRWRERLKRIDAQTANLRNLSLLLRGTLPETVFAFDAGKLLLCARGCSGYALARTLREQFHIELEMAAPGYALAMTGAGDTEQSLDRFAQALHALDAQCAADYPQMPSQAILAAVPELSLPPAEAVNAPYEFCPLSDCEGRVAAEYAWVYPPGIPLIVPGERINAQIAVACDSGTLQSTYGRLPQIAVVK